MKELAIGEEIRIRCVENVDCTMCTRCYFADIADTGRCPECDSSARADGKSVRFELVDTPDQITLPTDEEICTYSSMYYTGSAVHYVREGMRIMKKMIEERINKIE